MAVRDPWVTGTSSFDVEETRIANGATLAPATNAVKALTGIRPGPSNPGAVTASSTPDGFTHVAPFQAFIQSTRASNGGVYTFTNDAIADVNHLGGTYGTPANSTNPRNDLVIAYIPDTFYGDANSTALIRPVIGTPSGSPADPSLAAFPDAVTLARVRVNANATTITNANITDLRPPHTVALGGVLPTATATTRNALNGLYDGLTIYRRDRDWVEIYDGAAWRVQGMPIVSSSADLSAITNPSTGQTAYSTGDKLIYYYTGSAWRVQGAYRAVNKLASPAASVSFTIPAYLTDITIRVSARSTVGAVNDSLIMRVNSVSTGTSYLSTNLTVATTTVGAANNPSGVDDFWISNIPGNNANAGYYGPAHIDISGWNDPHSTLSAMWRGFTYPDSTANAWLYHGGGHFVVDGPYTTVQLLPGSGANFATNSQFTVTGHE